MRGRCRWSLDRWTEFPDNLNLRVVSGPEQYSVCDVPASMVENAGRPRWQQTRGDEPKRIDSSAVRVADDGRARIRSSGGFRSLERDETPQGRGLPPWRSPHSIRFNGRNFSPFLKTRKTAAHCGILAVPEFFLLPLLVGRSLSRQEWFATYRERPTSGMWNFRTLERRTGMAKTLYEILQVLPDASPEVIRAAYKSLAAKFHPDKDSSTEAARQFAEVQKAFETLSNPDARARYDRDLKKPSQTTSTTYEMVVMRVDGTSSHLTVDEHLKRGGRELSECDLSGLTLDGASFRGATLTRAKLDGSSFRGCDFRQANLTDCSAKNCKFPGVWFGGATILRADFSGSILRGAAFFGATAVWESKMDNENVRFSGGDGSKSVHDQDKETGLSTIELCDFSRCDLGEAQFSGPKPKIDVRNYGTPERPKHSYLAQWFKPCRVKESRFIETNLEKCDLKGISLIGSTFSNANLNCADMNGCNIADLNLSTCSVTNVDLRSADYSADTILPTGFRLPANAKRVDQVESPKSAAFDPQSEGPIEGVLVMLIIVMFSLIIGATLLFAL
jgi:uncharacterized protein YjbI with pentapeptide repeats